MVYSFICSQPMSLRDPNTMRGRRSVQIQQHLCCLVPEVSCICVQWRSQPLELLHGRPIVLKVLRGFACVTRVFYHYMMQEASAEKVKSSCFRRARGLQQNACVQVAVWGGGFLWGSSLLHGGSAAGDRAQHQRVPDSGCSQSRLQLHRCCFPHRRSHCADQPPQSVPRGMLPTSFPNSIAISTSVAQCVGQRLCQALEMHLRLCFWMPFGASALPF